MYDDDDRGFDHADPPARYYEPDEPPCEECGRQFPCGCEAYEQWLRDERVREADREERWWREVGGPLVGLGDEDEP